MTLRRATNRTDTGLPEERSRVMVYARLRSTMNSDARRALRKKKKALFDSAMAAWRRDGFAEALVYAEAAAGAAAEAGLPDGPTTLLLAELLLHVRRYEEAEKLLGRILDQPLPDAGTAADDSLAARRAGLARGTFLNALEVSGRLEGRRGRVEAAERFYRRYIEAAPESYLGHLELGTLLHRTGRLPEAEAALEAAARCDDADELVHRSIGFVLRTQGRLVNARDAFKRALAIDPDFKSAKHCLADIRAALEAERALERE